MTLCQRIAIDRAFSVFALVRGYITHCPRFLLAQAVIDELLEVLMRVTSSSEIEVQAKPRKKDLSEVFT